MLAHSSMHYLRKTIPPTLWQLRATNALAALWGAQGRLPEVHAWVAPLYASFDKQIMSADLRQAKALLANST